MSHLLRTRQNPLNCKLHQPACRLPRCEAGENSGLPRTSLPRAHRPLLFPHPAHACPHAPFHSRGPIPALCTGWLPTSRCSQATLRTAVCARQCPSWRGSHGASEAARLPSGARTYTLGRVGRCDPVRRARDPRRLHLRTLRALRCPGRRGGSHEACRLTLALIAHCSVLNWCSCSQSPRHRRTDGGSLPLPILSLSRTASGANVSKWGCSWTSMVDSASTPIVAGAASELCALWLVRLMKAPEPDGALAIHWDPSHHSQI
jgi:hypothetical protein